MSVHEARLPTRVDAELIPYHMSTRLEILDAPTESGAPRRLPIVDSGCRSSSPSSHPPSRPPLVAVSPTILLIQNSHRPTLSCQELREALASCVLKTDCVLKSSPPNTVQDCLRDHIDELPMECRHLRTAFFECKRGMVRPFLLVLVSATRADFWATSAARYEVGLRRLVREGLGTDARCFVARRKRFRGLDPGQKDRP